MPVTQLLLAIPIVTTIAFGGGFVANEWSHGALSEAMGLGHHHMLDYGQHHCIPHDDPNHGPAHREHMHDPDEPRPHDECPGHEGSGGTGQ